MINKRHNGGFSLIEIVIAVTIIVAVVAIMLPNLLRARLSANEKSAVQTLIAYQVGLRMYREGHSEYPGDLLLFWADDPPYVSIARDKKTGDDRFRHYGYLFVYTRLTLNNYQIVATPLREEITGNRWFRINAAGTLESKESVGGVWE